MSSSDAAAPVKASTGSGLSAAVGRKPPPSPLSPREPRNWTVSATTSTFDRLEPSCDSHSLHSRRPSTAIGRPFDRYWAQFSPCAPQTLMSKKLGRSLHSPVDWSLKRRFTARRSRHTDVPLGRVESSGSAVRLPVRMTRLMFATEFLLCLLYERAFGYGRDAVGRRVMLSPRPPRPAVPPVLPSA